SELETICRDCPFFSPRLVMLGMVFAKRDLWMAEDYDRRLEKAGLWAVGKDWLL
ncbi:phosphoenolpyruvate carboxylase, partial [Enterobacter hormaechei]|nr:phosphoenolpyruvate carboxylase [Enterobacter hormaechei]